ncbi:MAG TPA: DUF3352 domain-containing protein [Coleofasciculaceae cyanobacterium]
MKFRSFLYLLATLVLVLLLTAGAGAAWMITHSPIAQLRKAEIGVPSGTMFVSAQAPVVASLLVNPDRLQSAQLLAASTDRRQLQQDFHQLQQAFLPDAQLSYWRDIQPWLDNEITVAITSADVDRDPANGSQLGYLVVMTAKDSALAQRKLQSFWKRHARAKDLVAEPYAGVQIVYRSAAGKKRQDAEASSILTLASAVVGDRFVLLANSPKVLREALNNVQVAELALANSSFYQQALEQLPPRAIGLAFVNLPQLSAWATGKPEPPLPRTYESLLVTWNLESQVANTLLLASEPQPTTKPTLTAPVGALRFIPASSSLTLAGTDLPQRWAQLETAGAGYETGLGAVKQALATFEQAQHISLLEDVLSGVSGEYALGMLPRADRPQPDWVFVAQRSPATAAQWEKLDAIAQKQNVTLGSFTLDTPLGSQEIYAWTKFSTKVAQSARSSKTKSAAAKPVSLEATVQGVRTTVNDYDIFATSLEAMNLALQPDAASLLKNAKFQDAITLLNLPNEGYVYLDKMAIGTLLRQFPNFPDRIENPALNDLGDRLQALAITSYEQTGQVAKGAVAIQLVERN